MATLPPLADLSDLAAWLGVDSLEGDPRAGAALAGASALIRAYTGQSFDTPPVPDAVESVTVDVAGRVFSRAPSDAESRTVQTGAFSDTERYRGDGALYLSTANKTMLAEFRNSGNALGLGVLGTTRGEDFNPTLYVPTGPPPAGYDFPWYDADDPFLQP